MTPRWFQLLQYNQAHHHYGPTIPFILGSLRSPVGAVIANPQICCDELRSLLQEMLDNTPGRFVLRISRCDRLRQPIVAPFEAAYELQGLPLRSDVQNRDTLFVDREFVGEGSSVQTLLNALWRELSSVICKGRFSFNNGLYGPFTTDDRRLIEKALLYNYESDEET